MATRLLLVRLGVHLGGGNATGTRVGWLGSTAFIGVDVRVREHMLKAGGWRALSGVGSCLLVVLAAPGPMALWAFVVMALTALGMATMLIGLVVVVPLLAHASWHAYRDCVPSADPAPEA